MNDKIADKWEKFRSEEDGKWYVRTLSDTGEIILSSDGYENEAHAQSVGVDTGLPEKGTENV